MTDMIMTAALTEGQKALANFGIKLATVMGASVGSMYILKNVHELEEPISQAELKTPEGVKKALGRTARDSFISAGTAVTARVVYHVASEAVLNS